MPGPGGVTPQGHAKDHGESTPEAIGRDLVLLSSGESDTVSGV